MINILFAARTRNWAEWEAPLRQALDALDMPYALALDMPPEEVDYIIYAPVSELRDFTPYHRCKAVLNIWAGVEGIIDNPTLTKPLCRMVGGGLTEGMVEWVTGHVLRHHLGMDAHIVNPDHNWIYEAPPLAMERPVTVLGLGALGAAVGQSLTALGFPVTGWSRSQKQIPGLRCLAGEDGLKEALSGAQVVVLLLPNTPATENVLNATRLALLEQGAFIINPGRGALIDDDALLAALDTGQIGAATLDVFRVEPLPENHPYWAHPRVTVTPHVASETRATMGASVIAENIRRGETGEPLLYCADRAAGY